MELIRIRRAELARFAEQLRALEAEMSYPLGADRFRIDHGEDHFRFFERLGELYFYAWVDRGPAGPRVVATGAGVLRRVPFTSGGPLRRAWYGGDLKVHPEHRGRRLPLGMAYRLFLPNFLRCPRGYAISMNPGDGSPNRVVKNLTRFRLLPIDASRRLELYSLDAEAMARAAPIVASHRGPLAYRSLAGVKDLVLESTGRPLSLLHVEWGRGEGGAPSPGATHMFPAPVGDPLGPALAELGIRPSASATILSYGMAGADFRFVLTSDI